MAHQPLQTRAKIFEWEWGGVGWSGLLAGGLRRTRSVDKANMHVLSGPASEPGLAPPLTEILANCQDLFLIF